MFTFFGWAQKLQTHHVKFVGLHQNQGVCSVHVRRGLSVLTWTLTLKAQTGRKLVRKWFWVLEEQISELSYPVLFCVCTRWVGSVRLVATLSFKLKVRLEISQMGRLFYFSSFCAVDAVSVCNLFGQTSSHLQPSAQKVRLWLCSVR